jgi:hypothetical protein
LIETRQPVDEASLADPSVDLAGLIQAAGA